MKAALLPDRGVVKVAGDDARKFLNGLVTSDIAKVTPAAAGFGALLTPQGKIILDFIYGDAFPHETDMDQFGGVDFDKGCFVGQEVVSRIEHRGSARARIVPVSFDSFAPEAGTPVSVGDKTIGTLGSTTQGRGLA